MPWRAARLVRLGLAERNPGAPRATSTKPGQLLHNFPTRGAYPGKTFSRETSSHERLCSPLVDTLQLCDSLVELMSPVKDLTRKMQGPVMEYGK